MHVRNKWCVYPGKGGCWAKSGEEAHARVDGFDDAACKGQKAVPPGD